jgi:hypothetical protein
MNTAASPDRGTEDGFLSSDSIKTKADPHGVHESYWLWVLCLTGVDYFSTLAYQPSIAISAAGRLAPIATLFLVFITLFGAVPIYQYVAKSSFKGQGSIAMLQQLMSGWTGKLVVLFLLGFAATDFVITITLSAADAAEHLEHNPIWGYAPSFMHNHLAITNIMMLLLGALFLRGFREAISISVAIASLYLSLNIIVIGAGLWRIMKDPQIIDAWRMHLMAGEVGLDEHYTVPTSIISAILLSIFLFPKLALGLSGFETGVAVMPLVKGDPGDTADKPVGRIRNTQKLLLTAAVIMSFMLIGSSWVVTLLIPIEEMGEGGHAANRALAYLAHGEGPHQLSVLFGEGFGTLYDVSTIMILWFAGASALSGLLNLIPHYLPRYGMAPDWAAANKPLIGIIILVCLIVSIIFNASVEDQGAAYATGVMVLILSACIAVIIDKYRSKTGTFLERLPFHTVAIFIIFLYTSLAIMYEKPEGLVISSFFIFSIIAVSLISRLIRARELRVERFRFVDAQSKLLWESMKFLDIPVLAPHRPGVHSLDEKERELRIRHHLDDDIPIVFVEVFLGDTSDFFQEPLLEIMQDKGRFIINVKQCTAIAPALASICLNLSAVSTIPVEIHFGWSEENPLSTNLRFVLFGEGNIPWLVYDLLRRAEPSEERRPRVVIG